MPYIIPLVTTVIGGIGSAVGAIGGAIGAAGAAAGAAGAAGATAGGISALGWTSLALTAASGVASVISQRQQAKAAEQTAEYNAKVQENQAIQDRMNAEEQIRRDRVMAKKFAGSQRSAIGAAGVTFAGSPLEVLGETAGLAELQAQDSFRAAELRQRAGFAGAAGTRWEGQQRATGLRREAFGTILSTGAGLAKDYIGFKKAGVFGGG